MKVYPRLCAVCGIAPQIKLKEINDDLVQQTEQNRSDTASAHTRCQLDSRNHREMVDLP